MAIRRTIRETIQGKDGKASSRKVTALVFALVFIVTWFCDLFYDKLISELMLLLIGIIVLISLGLMTAQNVVDILKRPEHDVFSNFTNVRRNEDNSDIDSMDDPD